MPEYSLEGAKWLDSNITWSFATSTYGIDESDPFSSTISGDYQGAIRWALQQWSSAASLSFTESADNPDYHHSADLRIGFGMLDTLHTGVIGQTNLRWDGVGALVPDEIVRLEDPSQFALSPNGDGYTYAGTTATLRQVALHEIGHALGLGHASDPDAVMYFSVGAANQALDFTDVAGIQSLYGAPTSTPAPTSPSGGSDVLELHLSEDAWQGDARFIVSLDGQQLGKEQTVSALHALDQDQAFIFQGSFGVGTHDLAISFLNDAWGGTPDTDRNLYVNAANYDGVGIGQSTVALYSAGTAHFQVGAITGNAGWTGSDADSTKLGSFWRLT